VHQLDVKNAFLHGTLTETVYCSQTAGFVDSSRPDMVCRLNKSLYGLKQAPRAWYSRFATYLMTLGFVEAKSDTSLFIYHQGAETAYLLLYVDDIVLTASSPQLLWRIITSLQQEFAMKDLGVLHHFLGVKAGRKTRNSLARSTRSLMARLELDSFYNEPARFITSQLELARELFASRNEPMKIRSQEHTWALLSLGPLAQ
jgi:hypothetical protein